LKICAARRVAHIKSLAVQIDRSFRAYRPLAQIEVAGVHVSWTFSIGRSTIWHVSGMTAWSQVTSRTPGVVNVLLAVSADPAGSSTWAIGYYCACRTSSEIQALIMRGDGTAWSQVTSPSPGRNAQLLAVSSDPVGSTWAVGSYCTSGCDTNLETDQTLFLHWDSTARVSR
jgi:hypothetical protein